jgi:peptidoglycan/xylan/chitin deacetylase (PgdA/CDA1 family)
MPERTGARPSPRPVSAQRPPAVVHLDLDGARHIFRAHGWAYEPDDDPLFDSGLRGALDLFDRAGVRATLFVIAEDLDRPAKRALIEEAVRRGHDVASHSVTHRALRTLSPAGQRDEIAASRARIGSALGVKVAGFRAPGFGIDRQCLEMIADAGYTYDSSIFAAGRVAGLSPASAHPYQPLASRTLVELPVPRTGRWLPPFHPSYSLVLGDWFFRRGIASWAREQAPFVMLFHLTDFAEPLPATVPGNWSRRLYTLSHLAAADKRDRCLDMIASARQYFTFTTTEHLLSNPADSAALRTLTA